MVKMPSYMLSIILLRVFYFWGFYISLYSLIQNYNTWLLMDLPPTAPVLCSYGDSVGFMCNRFSALISISKISDPVNLKVDIFFCGTTFYQRKNPCGNCLQCSVDSIKRCCRWLFKAESQQMRADTRHNPVSTTNPPPLLDENKVRRQIENG